MCCCFSCLRIFCLLFVWFCLFWGLVVCLILSLIFGMLLSFMLINCCVMSVVGLLVFLFGRWF